MKNQMNILIFHPDNPTRETIRSQLEALGHAVIYDDASLYNVLIGTTKIRPDVVVLVEIVPAMRDRTEQLFKQWAITIPIVWLSPDLHGHALNAFLIGEFSTEGRS